MERATQLKTVNIIIQGSGLIAINASNIFEKISDRKVALEVALELVKTKEGMALLSNAELDSGYSALHSVVDEYEEVALELMETEEGMWCLANTKNTNRRRSALHSAMRHEKAALKSMETEEGRRLIAHTRDADGESALELAISIHPSVRAKLEELEKKEIIDLLRHEM
jgi:uncharacterized protein YlaN (UPF0358 family)